MCDIPRVCHPMSGHVVVLDDLLDLHVRLLVLRRLEVVHLVAAVLVADPEHDQVPFHLVHVDVPDHDVLAVVQGALAESRFEHESPVHSFGCTIMSTITLVHPKKGDIHNVHTPFLSRSAEITQPCCLHVDLKRSCATPCTPGCYESRQTA